MFENFITVFFSQSGPYKIISFSPIHKIITECNYKLKTYILVKIQNMAMVQFGITGINNSSVLNSEKITIVEVIFWYIEYLFY